MSWQPWNESPLRVPETHLNHFSTVIRRRTKEEIQNNRNELRTATGHDDAIGRASDAVLGAHGLSTSTAQYSPCNSHLHPAPEDLADRWCRPNPTRFGRQQGRSDQILSCVGITHLFLTDQGRLIVGQYVSNDFVPSVYVLTGTLKCPDCKVPWSLANFVNSRVVMVDYD